jgi:alpha-1,4-glucan:alpha-1,4-glucan 6-glycosyltransferase/4-alpha-glucanotransferase
MATADAVPPSGERPSAPPGLEELARSHGVELLHLDGMDREVHPSPEVLTAIVGDLEGEPLDPDDAMDRLRRREARLQARVVEPVSVAWADGPVAVRAGPALSRGDRVDFRVAEEGWDGAAERTILEGSAVVGARGLVLPGRLPWGYYTVQVEGGGVAGEGCLIVSPPRAYREGRAPDGPGGRDWGVFLPLHALRSERDWGTGDLTDLGRLRQWVAERGGRAVGILPIMSSFLDHPFEPSPYAPVSRRFWNEIYLDPTRLPEWHFSPEARRRAATEELRLRIGRAREADLAQLREVHLLASELLDILARTWARQGGEAQPEFRQFAARYPDVRRYAAFRAVADLRRDPWPEWPEAWRHREIPREEYDTHAYRRHLYAQFRFHTQLEEPAREARAGAGLYLDLPLGAHPHGYDTWSEPGLHAERSSLGAPPDAFHVEGQNWGLPPVRPERARKDGHRELRAILRTLLPHSAYLRVDHIMGLGRQYWIPTGAGGGAGAYVRYPEEELMAVLCLESHRHRTVLVGEDLGTVPPGIRDEMDRRGLGRMYVLPFELPKGKREKPTPVPPGAAASLNTHDLPTFAANLAEPERGGRLLTATKALLGQALSPPSEDWPEALRLLDGALQWLGQSSAGLVMVNLEDLWLEQRPQNVPGTASEANWRRKALLALEEFEGDGRVLRILDHLDRARRAEPPTLDEPGTVGDRGVEAPAMVEQDLTQEPTSPAGSPRGSSAEGKEHPMETDDAPGSDATALTAQDLYLFNEGTHIRLYRKLGAHLSTDPDRPGVRFAVWAPSARAVSVVGDFNGWDPGAHPMAPKEFSGIWEAFVPEARRGSLYKYHIAPRGNEAPLEKADPFGFRHEVPPATASVVWDLEYDWGDSEWMAARKERNHHEAPISVYEVHLGSWRRDPDRPDRLRGYRELASELASYVKELGFTHVEFLPVTEHPFFGSWGYQTTGYFAPTSRYGSPQDFMHLVDHLHQEGIGVILDWVPSHFPTDAHGLARFDGTHLYEHADPRQGFHPDWTSLIFNYGRHEVRSFLLSSALFWLDRYHVDGLRVDAVASMLYLDYSREEGDWIPNRYGGRENLEAIAFLRRLNEEVYGNHPDVQTVAEESTAWPMVSRPTYVGGLGFGMKWDMGWMHDTLRFLARDPVHRKYHYDELTFRAIYQFNENFMLPLSHDEVVHGKGSLMDRMPGDGWQKRANLRLLFAYQFLQPGKKLLFMGCELGQRTEWHHDGEVEWEILDDPDHAGIQGLVADLNRLYREEPTLHRTDFSPEAFRWIEAHDREQSILAFMREDPSGDGGLPLVAVFNLVPVPRENYRIGVPRGGRWTEVLNTDAQEYGGSGWGNMGGMEADPVPCGEHYHSLMLSLPPLGAVVLKGGPTP